jgi:hypothetical protein
MNLKRRLERLEIEETACPECGGPPRGPDDVSVSFVGDEPADYGQRPEPTYCSRCHRVTTVVVTWGRDDMTAWEGGSQWGA